MKRVSKDPEDQFGVNNLIAAFPDPQWSRMILKQHLFLSQLNDAANALVLTKSQQQSICQAFEQQTLEMSRQIRLWRTAAHKEARQAAFDAMMALPSMTDLVHNIVFGSRKHAA